MTCILCIMDHAKLASELMIALRGKRSQSAFSRRLGYRSNVASRWEAGLAFPGALQLLEAAQRSGVDLRAGLSRFFVVPRPWLQGTNPCSKRGVIALLKDLRGATPIRHLVEQTGYSRFQLSRWLSGESELRLPEFLKLVDVLSLRLPDFVQLFVDPERLPSLRRGWHKLCAAREAAFARPWSHAVLRALELRRYAQGARHVPGAIAGWLGISAEEEAACLKLLERAGQIKKRRGRYVLNESLAVDLRAEPLRLRGLKSFWLDAARQRLDAGAPGAFGFNVFAVSEHDLVALRESYLAFYQQLQRRIAASSPSEAVALFSAQLLRLDLPPPGAGS